jgi:transcriptional regulator with XRE-family HTH domain
MPNNTTADRVRIALAAAGVRQQKLLAEPAGLSPNALSERMRGVTPWGLRDVQRIAKHLGVPTAELIGDLDDDEDQLSRPDTAEPAAESGAA